MCSLFQPFAQRLVRAYGVRHCTLLVGAGGTCRFFPAGVGEKSFWEVFNIVGEEDLVGELLVGGLSSALADQHTVA